MKLKKKEIADMWTLISKLDVWLACKRGIDFDLVKSNFSEDLVSHNFYKKITDDEQNADYKANELEAFRKDRKN